MHLNCFHRVLPLMMRTLVTGSQCVNNVITNSPKISDLSKRDILQLNLFQIDPLKGKKVLSCRFQHCLGPVNTLITEGCSQTGPLKH